MQGAVDQGMCYGRVCQFFRSSLFKTTKPKLESKEVRFLFFKGNLRSKKKLSSNERA